MLTAETTESTPNVFVMPQGLEIDETTLTETYGRFTVQPLERGFATTLGNGVRRTLLSSLEGAAIEAIRIEGVQHEFSAVTGVLEDVPQIVLHLKEVRLKLHAEEKKTIHVSKKGAGTLVAGDLEVDSDVEVVNKDHVIATIEAGATLAMEIEIGHGRGFVLADDRQIEEPLIGTIQVDSVYSPIRRVNYEVSTARVGQRTDYDKLTLDVWTDGTTTPRAAVAHAARLIRSHLQLFLEEGEVEEFASAEKQPSQPQSALDLHVDQLDLSMRSINCLRAAGIQTVEELVLKSENDMLKYRNFGRKSLVELTEKLESLGVRFGMSPEEVAEARESGVSVPQELKTEEEG